MRIVQDLDTLTTKNTQMLSWVPVHHQGVEGSVNAGKLLSSLSPTTSKVAAKDVAKMWAREEQFRRWQVLPESVFVKCIVDKPSHVLTISLLSSWSGWQPHS